MQQGETLHNRDHRPVASLRHDYENANDIELFLHSVGAMWGEGIEISWERLHTGKRLKVSLPTYAFERERFWLDNNKPAAESAAPTISASPSTSIDDWFYVPSWSRTVFPSSPL